MAQVRGADRATSQAAIYFAAALIAAIVLTAMVATGTLNIFGVGSPSLVPHEVNPALLQAERDWESQRRQQIGEHNTYLLRLIDAPARLGIGSRRR